MKTKFTFHCLLTNKGEYEEDFRINIVDTALCLARDRIEYMLTKEYGYITMRTYFKENMKSERYWNIKLENMEILEEKEKSK